MKQTGEQWRVFVAMELPADVRRGVMDHIDRLRKSMPEVRASWSRDENLHLTLKFLGDVPVANADALSKGAEHAARVVAPFEIIVGGCGAFPPQGYPRVLWIGIEDSSGHLRTLHEALESECAKIGFARDERQFHPHLTIARVRSPQGSRRLAELHEEIGFAPLRVKVSDLCVVRSELSSEGSRHTPISQHKFSAGM